MSESKLYVGNMSFDTTQSSVENAFSAFGNVQSVTIITDRETGQSRGFAFVEMSNDAEARAAIEGMEGKELDGRTLTVNIAKPRQNRGGGGGGGFDRGGRGGGGGRDRGRDRW